MRKLKLLLACLFVASIGLVNAQTKTISGTVVSAEDGQPIIGASVLVKGTTTGTSTNVEGKFSLSAPANTKTVIVSYVGRKTAEVNAGTGLMVRLEQSEKVLDEVMVVAYGTAKKSNFTGSATAVSGEKLAKKSTSEVTKSLAGEIAGVQVVNSSGQPGSNASIRIRGIGSINSSSAPLYIVDGVPYVGDISAIAPGDIESTTILKDATATALYGSRGANGVILITTKKGVPGKSAIEVEAKVGLSERWIPLYNSIDSPERYAELAWESARNKEWWAYGQYYKNIEEVNAYVSEKFFSLTDNGPGGMSYDFFPASANIWNGDPTKLIDPTTGKFFSGITRKYNPEKWAKNIFNTGKKSELNLKLSGGEGGTSYFSSLGLLNDQGYYIGSDFSRVNARLNVDHKVKSWLKGNMNMNYSYMERNQPGQEENQNNGFQFVNFMPPIYDVFMRDADGNKMPDTRVGGYMYDYGFGNPDDPNDDGRPYAWGINPAGALKLDKHKTKLHQFAGNAMLEASFLKRFKVSSNFGVQYLGSFNDQLTNPYYGDAKGVGRIRKVNATYMNIMTNQILSYSNKFNSHNIDAFVAHETNVYENSILDGQKSKIAKPEGLEFSNAIIMDNIDSDTYQYNIESYFGQVKYDFNERYFLHGTLRADGSSRFQKGKRWGTFGSVGAAWAVSNEDFMKSVSFLDNLKYKISWGVLGNQAFIGSPTAAGFYPTEDLYNVGNLQDQLYLTLAYKGNPNLTWERSKTFNTGVEFGLFNKLLTGEIEYFHKTTDNMLFSKQIATSNGIASKTYNEGVMINQGIEFNLTANVLDIRNVKLALRLNGSHYKNKLVKMPLDAGTGKEKPYEIQGEFAWSNGHSIYDYYMREWAGVDPANGKALWNQYFNEKEDGTKEPITDMKLYEVSNTVEKLLVETTSDYTKATKKYVGKSAIPTLVGGFGFDFEAYGFELNTTFAYSLGGYGYDYIYASLMRGNSKIGSTNYHKDIEKHWTETNTVTDVPRIANNYTEDDAQNDVYQSSVSTRFLTSNSYLHLANVRLGYNFSKKLLSPLKINSLNVYVTGENLLLLTSRDGYVPINSLTGINGRSDYAPVSTIMAGLKISF